MASLVRPTEGDSFNTGRKYIAGKFLLFAGFASARALTQTLSKEAIKEDNAGNYVKAKNLYERGIQFFLHTIKYSKNEKEKEVMTQRV